MEGSRNMIEVSKNMSLSKIDELLFERKLYPYYVYVNIYFLISPKSFKTVSTENVWDFRSAVKLQLIESKSLQEKNEDVIPAHISLSIYQLAFQNLSYFLQNHLF